MIRRIFATLCLTVLAAAAWADDGLVAEGRQLYLQGVRRDGGPLIGVRAGGERMQGRDMACVQCHRRSGMGTVEGEVIAPPIVGRILGAPGSHPPGSRPRRAAGMALQEPGFRTRPPYEGRLLARALREGIGAGGDEFDGVMPRYVLSDREIEALAAYLQTLEVGSAPGVDTSEKGLIRLATVTTPDADPNQRDAMLQVLQTCISERSPRFGGGRLPWVLEEWRLSGPAGGWRSQLEARMRAQPAFALVSGIGRDWTEVHAFCESEGVPCLFPNTDAPGSTPAPYASVYLSRGVLVEGSAVAGYLELAQSRPKKVLQVLDPDDIGRFGAAALAEEMPGTLQVREHFSGAADVGRVHAQISELGPTDVLVLWLDPASLEVLFAGAPKPHEGLQVVVSGTMAELDRKPDARTIPASWRAAVRVAYPFDLPDARLGRMVFNLGGWLAGRGQVLTRSTERTQGNTYSACEVASRALYTMAGRYSRDYLLELVEDSYAGAIATAYPRFTLGAGQRYGSKGAYLMKVGEGGAMLPDGDWLVP